MENQNFTDFILEILAKRHGKETASILLDNSLLLQYICQKTKSANRGSKSRGSFANLYAIYVIVEDYIAKGFDAKEGYSDYEGAKFVNLFTRQRELPFGSKLQNHALNNRMNAEFAKYFPTCEYVPIMLDLKTQRYWINENLLRVEVNGERHNIARDIVGIIDEYAKAKQDSFNLFIMQCEALQSIDKASIGETNEFIKSLLAPNVDARLFEIVSYAILKYHFKGQTIVWGYNWDELNEEELKLYKTGRTNANDGGIDFVMKPLGRFFQVTETIDFKKYFLDIDKIEKYPITFIVKTEEEIETLRHKLHEYALKTFVVKEVANKYMTCIEDIINIPCLLDCFASIAAKGGTEEVLNEIILQSKVEFNYEEDF